MLRSPHFERLIPEISPADEHIEQVIMDAQGRYWFAGSYGLLKLEAGRWTRYTTKDGLRSNMVDSSRPGPTERSGWDMEVRWERAGSRS